MLKRSVTLVCAGLLGAVALFSFGTARAVEKSVTHTAQMTQPHLPNAPVGGTDDYRCFLLDPKITQDSIITSVRFLPQVRKIMHHMILFQVGEQDLNTARALDNNGEGWPCFGGTGVGSGFSSFLTSPWVSSWAPGRDRDVMPAGFGTSISKGAQLVIQIHYNLLAISDSKIPTDQSSIQITAEPAAGSELKILYSELVAAPVEIACPKGVTGPLCTREASLIDLARRTTTGSAFEAAGLNLLCGKSAFRPIPSVVSTCDIKITRSELVVKATPHMHLLGKSLKMILNPGTAKEKVLLNRPKYNFDDQSPTVLSQPVKLVPGDVVRVQCTFDPKLRSLLPELKKLPPRYITWGEGSSDEMCLGVLGVSRM